MSRPRCPPESFPFPPPTYLCLQGRRRSRQVWRAAAEPAPGAAGGSSPFLRSVQATGARPGWQHLAHARPLPANSRNGGLPGALGLPPALPPWHPSASSALGRTVLLKFLTLPEDMWWPPSPNTRGYSFYGCPTPDLSTRLSLATSLLSGGLRMLPLAHLGGNAFSGRLHSTVDAARTF